MSRAERRAVESLQAQIIGPKAIDPQTGASFEVADEDLLRSLARCLAPDFQQTASIAERTNIARTIAQLVQARHRIAAPKVGLSAVKLHAVEASSDSWTEPPSDEPLVTFS